MRSTEDMIATINRIVDAANGPNGEFESLVNQFLGKEKKRSRVKKVKEPQVKARRGIGSY